MFKVNYPSAITLFLEVGSPAIFGLLGLWLAEMFIPSGLYTDYKQWVQLSGCGVGIIIGYLLMPIVWVLLLRPALSLTEIEKFMGMRNSPFARRAKAIIHWWKY